MVPNLTAILPRVTGEWAALLQPDAMLAACAEVGYTGWRDRVRPPVTTVQIFLWQSVHGNTACGHLPQMSGRQCTAAASSQALYRQRWQVETALAHPKTAMRVDVSAVIRL